MQTFDKSLLRFLIASLCYLDAPVTPAHAAMVPTYSIIAANRADSPRQKLQRYLALDDVRAGLEKNGVTPAAEKARVAPLSDDEVAAVAGKFDALPAGGECVGVMVFIFVLLPVMNIPGFTKVYSVTRPVSK